MIEMDRSYLAYIAGGAVVAVSAAAIIKKIFFSFRTEDNYPDDVVILHQTRRGMWAPSISPFALKLETYLRMANIPYKNDLVIKFSKVGKFPWMTYNGEEVADSQFCIEYLKVKLGKDLNRHLTSEERAIARAFQRLTEENLFWMVPLWNWCFEWTRMKQHLIKIRTGILILHYMARLTMRDAWGHGIGRHSKEELQQIARTDLTALSSFLGNKKFLMGSEPSEIDASVFGLLAQFKWHMQHVPPGKIMNEFSNLSDYCDRMKERFWPDWNDCITYENTREPLK